MYVDLKVLVLAFQYQKHCDQCATFFHKYIEKKIFSILLRSKMCCFAGSKL